MKAEDGLRMNGNAENENKDTSIKQLESKM
jgi:hypothetical protein